MEAIEGRLGRGAVFGCHLDELAECPPQPVLVLSVLTPLKCMCRMLEAEAFLQQAMSRIEELGGLTEGVYRVSASVEEVSNLRRQANQGSHIDFGLKDAHVCAGFVKVLCT